MDIQEMQARRKKLGYTYRMLSDLANIPLPTVQKVLGGFTKSPRYGTMQALEKVLAPDPLQKKPQHMPEGNPEADRERVPQAVQERVSQNMSEAGRMYTPVCDPACSGQLVSEPQAAYRAGEGVHRPVLQEGSCYPMLPQKRQGDYTAADREALPEDVHTELIDGVLYDMASPKYTHQILVTELLTQINAQIEKCGRECLAFSAPSDVWLTGDDRNIFQPDIYVICDYDMLGTDGYVRGAPPFIVEVLSPSTRSRDLLLKAFKYHEAGVLEYWIVDPDEDRIVVYDYERDPDGTVNTVYSFTEDIPIGISGGRRFLNLRRAKAILDRIRERG